jgi:hypothetical protein
MFPKFSKAVLARFAEMSKGELFVVNADDIFARYLAAFPEGTNPIYRVRTEYDCNCCKKFVERLGIVVAIKNGKLTTLWGDLDVPPPFKEVADALDTYVRSLPIESVFRTVEKKYSVDHNYDTHVPGLRHDHFYGEVGNKHCTHKADTERGEKNTTFAVFKRGLTELREKDFDDVLELIRNNSLYKGQEFKPAIEGFQKLIRGYKASGCSDLFIWENLDNRNATFRSISIGNLFVDLAKGEDFDKAVISFERTVAPENYKRPTSAITQRMVEEAVVQLTELELGGAIYRRYARLSDISTTNVLFVDNESRHKMKDGAAALLESSIKKSTPDLTHAVLIPAESFVKDILPTAKSVEVLVQNSHTGNFVSLTGSDGPERPFKWNNNFAWSYEGNVTDSVKQRVKKAGGNINADLRVSLSWFNTDDLDLHASCPYGHIYYGDKKGILDVDMNAHTVTRNPVENLAFNKPRDGVYRIYVNQYNRRNTTDFGFSIEIEIGGRLRQFSHEKSQRSNEEVPCFTFAIRDGKVVNLESPLKEGTASQEKWGIKTETLNPVTVIAYSPNHWDNQSIGAKHLIFGLRDCINPEPTRGIYNEYLKPELEKHRKVFEVLGAKAMCKPTPDQVSGLGFTAARGDTVTVVVDGRRSYTLVF